MARQKKPAADSLRLGRGSPGLPALAVALTFALRLWFILEMRGEPFSVISAQTIDSWYYHTWALDILHKSFWGNEVFFLRPLYPYLLAGLYALFGPNVFPVQLFQCFLAAASCFLLYDSARRIFGHASALLAAFGFALTGILVFYSGALLYVEVTVFFSLLTMWLLPTAQNTVWRWALAGISFGLMVICRPEMLILLPAFIIVLWRAQIAKRAPAGGQDSSLSLRMNPRRRLLPVVVLTACALATIAVVPIRNLIVAREPVLFTAHSGINFYYGWNPWTDGTWQQTELERTTGFSHQQLKRVSRMIDGKEASWSQASAYWSRRALAFIAQNPGRALWLIGRKFLLFWSNYEVPSNYYPETARPYSRALKLTFLNFGVIAALGLVGIFLVLRRKGPRVRGLQGSSAVPPSAASSSPPSSLPPLLWPLFFILAYLVSSLAFYVLSRLRAPVIPFLLMFAGYAVAEIISAVRQKKWLKPALAVAAAIVVYIGSNLIPVDRLTYTAQAWTQAGNTYLAMSDARAFDAFRKALDANPANPVARYGLFVAYAGMGRTAEAEREYGELAKVVGEDPRNRVLAELAGGRIAIARRNFPRALVHYRNAVALDPLSAENRYLLGLVYVSMDSLPQAYQALSGALEIDPNHDAARSSLEAVKAHLSARPQR